MGAARTQPSFCRTCPNCCPTLVDVDGDRIVAITGDRDNDVFAGYTCSKGREQVHAYRHPDRLLHPRVRDGGGALVATTSAAALDDLATRLTALLDRYGPRSVAGYYGTAITNNGTAEPFLSAFLRAIGSPLLFGPNTIDKPGKQLARALFGSWQAPLQGYDRPDVALVLGANPYRSYFGTACGHPHRWLSERLAAGMALIVVDPRRSDLAKRATVHLQPEPGHDAALLAALLHVILAEGLEDRAFVTAHTVGLDDLRAAVAPFTPSRVAATAGVDADALVDVARRFALARRGYCAAGVGPGFADSSTLVEYLVLALETVCGHWLRAGETVARTPTLLPPRTYRAQADPPRPASGFGVTLHGSGLTSTVAGLPTAGAADEMLLDGDDRIRALLVVGGNPMTAWPQQAKVAAALDRLDVLLCIDPWMSATAVRATHVLAPKLAYEVPGLTLPIDSAIDIGTYYGPAAAYAQWTPAVVPAPAGSDVLAEWEVFYGLGRRMGVALDLGGYAIDGATSGGKAVPMDVAPTDDELVELLAAGSRVPLEVVQREPHGSLFPDPPVVVADGEPGWTGRLQLADRWVLQQLAERARRAPPSLPTTGLRLIGARVQHRVNSTSSPGRGALAAGDEPAALHPDDLEALGIEPGDRITLVSSAGRVDAIARADADLRRGLVRMAHGVDVNRLVDGGDVVDGYVGMPRMGGIAVTIRPALDGSSEASHHSYNLSEYSRRYRQEPTS